MTDSNKRTEQSIPNRTTSGLAHALHVQELERHLDLNIFLQQLDSVFAEQIQMPRTISVNNAAANVSQNATSVQSDIWQDERSRKRDLGALYNFSTVGKRKWLKNILLEDSDSDSDEQITDADIKALLKIHKYRRKYQKRYHTDIINSQYTYYSAGLLSEQDRHPHHQRYILDQYGFNLPEPVVLPSATLPVLAPQKKISTNSKRRKSSASGAAASLLLRSDSSISYSAVSTDNPPPALEQQQQAPVSKKSKTNNKSPSIASSSSSAVATSASASADFAVARGNEKLSTTDTIALIQQQLIDDKPVVGMDPALKALWKTIVTEDIPKIAMSCVAFLQQAKSGNIPGKNKSRQRKQHKNEPMGLRPIPPTPNKPTPPNGSNSSLQ